VRRFPRAGLHAGEEFLEVPLKETRNWSEVMKSKVATLRYLVSEVLGQRSDLAQPGDNLLQALDRGPHFLPSGFLLLCRGVEPADDVSLGVQPLFLWPAAPPRAGR
jgi:hypothetical protein